MDREFPARLKITKIHTNLLVMSIEKIFLMYLKVNQKDDDAKVDQGVWS